MTTKRSDDLCIVTGRHKVQSGAFGLLSVETASCWLARDMAPTFTVATALLVMGPESKLWCLNHIYVMPEFRRNGYASQLLDQLVLMHKIENLGACWATPEGARFASSWLYERSMSVPWWQIVTDAEELEPPEPEEGTARRIGQ